MSYGIGLLKSMRLKRTPMTTPKPSADIGRHVLVDFFGCAEHFDADGLTLRLTAAAQAAGATILGGGQHDFTENNGATAFLMLAESHISAHTWPEHGVIAIDIFICGETSADAALESLRGSFQPARETITVQTRGSIGTSAPSRPDSSGSADDRGSS